MLTDATVQSSPELAETTPGSTVWMRLEDEAPWSNRPGSGGPALRSDSHRADWRGSAENRTGPDTAAGPVSGNTVLHVLSTHQAPGYGAEAGGVGKCDERPLLVRLVQVGGGG